MSCPSFAARSSAALRAVSLTLVLAAVACDDAATPVSPAASPDRALAGKGVVRSEGFIAFMSNRDGASSIHVMKPEGSEVTKLTADASDQAPSGTGRSRSRAASTAGASDALGG